MQSSVKKRSNIGDDGQTFLLGTAWEQIFAVHVLSFLSSHELCISSSTNRFFHHCTKTNHLWLDLMKANFCFPYDNYQQDNNKYNTDNANNHINNGYINFIQNASIYGTPRGTVRNGRGENFSGSNSVISAKDRYAMRVFDRNERYQKARDKAILSVAKIEKDRQRRLIQSFLDLTLFRILIPLPLTTLFLSILLFTLHYDGFNISIWAAAAPLIFYFIYLLVFTIVSYVVYKQQSNASKILYELWGNVHSPIKSFYTDTLRGSPFLVRCAVCTVFMCLLQIIFVAIKLTPSGISSDIILNLNWGAVFAPSWVLFLIVPLLARGREPATLFLAFLLIWVPFFVVLICITVKLNRQQYYGNGPDIRMALIFLPFWIIEGAVMLGALLFVFFGIHTLRLGLITGIYEHIGIFMATWSLFGPFVAFQALICYYDDTHSSKLSHAESVVPVLILIGWFFVCAVFFAFRSTTPFQEMQCQSLRENAGTDVIFDI